MYLPQDHTKYITSSWENRNLYQNQERDDGGFYIKIKFFTSNGINMLDNLQ